MKVQTWNWSHLDCFRREFLRCTVRTHTWSHVSSASLRYLVFYCPLNLFYKCVAFLPVKLVLVALKEVVRVRKIAAGVHHAHHAYHHGYFIMVIVGYIKGQQVFWLMIILCVLLKLKGKRVFSSVQTLNPASEWPSCRWSWWIWKEKKK